VGPNGCGKSTLVNVLAGTLRPQSGQVMFGGDDISGMTADERARSGIGRTFQGGSIFGSLSVEDNVMAAWECRHVGASPWRALRGSQKQRLAMRRAAGDAMREVGISALSERRAKDLSTGEQRLVEVARIIAAGFDVALLDECGAGLDAAACDRFVNLMLKGEGKFVNGQSA
jgi:ABC-type branched-subunit amino acid transport system ATPase component